MLRMKKIYFCYLLIFVYIFSSCSCSHDYTDIEGLCSHVSRMIDVSKDTKVYWKSLLGPEAPWCNAHTIGDLEKLLQEGNNPNHPMEGDTLKRLPIDALEMIPMGSKGEKLISRLAAIHLLLKYGSDPQRMTAQPGTGEEEYALFIMHGMKATAPVTYGAIMPETQYPLTRRRDFITYPVAKWLLENGADPNQKAIGSDGLPPEKVITPLKNIHSRRLKFFPEQDADVRAYRTPERVKRVHDLLVEKGAKEEM